MLCDCRLNDLDLDALFWCHFCLRRRKELDAASYKDVADAHEPQGKPCDAGP